MASTVKNGNDRLRKGNRRRQHSIDQQVLNVLISFHHWFCLGGLLPLFLPSRLHQYEVVQYADGIGSLACPKRLPSF